MEPSDLEQHGQIQCVRRFVRTGDIVIKSTFLSNRALLHKTYTFLGDYGANELPECR